MARSTPLSVLAIFAGSLVALRQAGFSFVGSTVALRSTRARTDVARFYDSGKVNLNVDISEEEASPPLPVLECDEGCLTAIFDCLEEGCSVEALGKLDKELAEDEAKITTAMSELKDMQKTTQGALEAKGTIAWLDNFLSRSGSLRAQLTQLKTIKDADFVKQMVKAASVAFGGGRKDDYPKVGVSPYSE